MAYEKSLLLTDVFPNADFNTGSQTFEIPLSDLTSEGLDLTEATAEDARKFVLAVVRACQTAQGTITSDYTTSQANPAYTAGADYDAGDKVIYQGAEYIADNAITSAPATLNTADWTEQTIKQPVENFLASSATIRWATDGLTGTQNYTIGVTYSNSYDVANEA